MNRYKLVIFDFDGTLFATHEAIIHCVKQTFEIYKKTVPSHDEIYQTITRGIGLEDTFMVLNSDRADDKENIISMMVDTYREIYKKEGDSITVPFDHVKDTLDHIYQTQVSIVVISNKGINAINAALLKYDLKQYITLVIGDTPGMKKKPDPMVYDQIIKPKFKDIMKNEILMIGDTSSDLLFAKNIGVDACWAAYGYGNHEECKKLKYSYAINEFNELKNFFESPALNLMRCRL